MPLGLFNAVASAGVGLVVVLWVASGMPAIKVCSTVQINTQAARQIAWIVRHRPADTAALKTSASRPHSTGSTGAGLTADSGAAGRLEQVGSCGGGAGGEGAGGGIGGGLQLIGEWTRVGWRHQPLGSGAQ
jgi:hypothetical protein